MKKGKRPIRINGVVKNVETREGLWDEFQSAVVGDPRELFPNRSEAIRYFMVKYIEEVNTMIKCKE